MNASQRKFLIERIQEKVKNKIAELKQTRQDHPSASNYIFRAVLNGTIELQPHTEMLAAITKKAMAAKEGDNWLSKQRMGYGKESEVTMNIGDIFILPADYLEEARKVTDHNQQINEEIKNLEVQLDTIEVRVQLASDKTLQNLINEVDDMGSLSLIDTKLKLLN